MLLEKSFTEAELCRFDGMTQDAIRDTLRAEGYRETVTGTGEYVFAKDDESRVLKMTASVHKGRAFVDMCRDHSDNPYFPQIGGSHLVSGDAPVFMFYMEKLTDRSDLPKDAQTILGGMARALATLIHGHDDHNLAHTQMLRKDDLRDAVMAILDTKLAYLEKKKPGYVFFNGKFEEDKHETSFPHDPISDWYYDEIKFRKNADGLTWQMVFADPFHEAPIDCNTLRENLRAEFNGLKARIEDMIAAKNKSPAVTPGS